MADMSLAFDILARDRASKTFNDVGDSVDRSGGKLAKFGKVAAISVGAVAVGAGIAGKALFDMAKGAAEDEKGQVRLATALRNAAGATDKQVASVEDWITAQGKALGVADDDLRPALGRLVASTHDVGKAQKLASLAMDVSKGSGKSLSTVTEALAKAQNGSLGGLARLGVKTKDAAGKARDLRDITKDLAKTYGGQAAAAADTTAGKWERVKLRFDETKESIGAKLLPVAEKLGSWMLDKGLPAVEKLGKWWSEKLAPPLRDFGEKIAPKVADLMDKVKGEFRDAQPFLDLVGKVFTNVLWPAFKKGAEIYLPILGKQLEIMGKGIGLVGQAGIWLWNNAFGPTIRFLLKGFSMVTEGWAIVLRGLSHIPGFGWAKDAADKMDGAARKARELAGEITDIKNKGKDVKLNFTVQVHGKDALDSLLAGPLKPKAGHNARGTKFWDGGLTWVGEEGPELINAPRGSRIHTATESARMAEAGGSSDDGGQHWHFHGIQDLRTMTKIVEREQAFAGGQ